MEDGFGKIKKVAKRVGDTASEFEAKAEPVVDSALSKLVGSGYTVRIILGVVVVGGLAWVIL